MDMNKIIAASFYTAIAAVGVLNLVVFRDQTTYDLIHRIFGYFSVGFAISGYWDLWASYRATNYKSAISRCEDVLTEIDFDARKKVLSNRSIQRDADFLMMFGDNAAKNVVKKYGLDLMVYHYFDGSIVTHAGSLRGFSPKAKRRRFYQDLHTGTCWCGVGVTKKDFPKGMKLKAIKQELFAKDFPQELDGYYSFNLG